MSPTDILILDGESNFALKVVRSLAQTRRWRIHVLGGEARPKCPALQWSRHIESYRHIRDGLSDEATIETIKRTVTVTGAKLIVPVTEPTSLLCIRHRAELEKVTSVAALPGEESFTSAIDKGLLAQFCASHDIPHPATVLSTDRTWEKLTFPVLIKPRRLSGGRGITRMNSQAELTAELPRHSAEQTCVQQVVGGVDFSCSVLVRNGCVEAYTIQRCLRQPAPFAPQSEMDFEDCTPVRELAENLFSKLRWSGVANIDCRLDPQTGEAVLLEVNGRYWASVLASTAAGVNFPDLACCMAIGQPLQNTTPRKGQFIKLTTACSDLLRLRSGALCTRWTSLPTLLSDPLPELHRCIRIAA